MYLIIILKAHFVKMRAYLFTFSIPLEWSALHICLINFKVGAFKHCIQLGRRAWLCTLYYLWQSIEIFIDYLLRIGFTFFKKNQKISLAHPI